MKPPRTGRGSRSALIRAVAGWPLGDARRYHDCVMTNLIGYDADFDPAGLDPRDTLTLYGKRDIRAARKMGHITRLLGPV